MKRSPWKNEIKAENTSISNSISHHQSVLDSVPRMRRKFNKIKCRRVKKNISEKIYSNITNRTPSSPRARWTINGQKNNSKYSWTGKINCHLERSKSNLCPKQNEIKRDFRSLSPGPNSFDFDFYYGQNPEIKAKVFGLSTPPGSYRGSNYGISCDDKNLVEWREQIKQDSDCSDCDSLAQHSDKGDFTRDFNHTFHSPTKFAKNFVNWTDEDSNNYMFNKRSSYPKTNILTTTNLLVDVNPQSINYILGNDEKNYVTSNEEDNNIKKENSIYRTIIEFTLMIIKNIIFFLILPLIYVVFFIYIHIDEE